MRMLETAAARESNLYRKNRRGPRNIAVAVSSEEISRIWRKSRAPREVADRARFISTTRKRQDRRRSTRFTNHGHNYSPETVLRPRCELAYGLPWMKVRNQRHSRCVITLITQCRVDADRVWTFTNGIWRIEPFYPPLIYWGSTSHRQQPRCNGRDAEAHGKCTEHVRSLASAVLHDLHESVPYFTTTVGDGPYNAWIDPILADDGT